MTATNAWTPRIVGPATERPGDPHADEPTDGIETVQLLDPEARPHRHHTYSPQLSVDEVRHAYRTMFLARRLDTEGTNLQRQGQLALWAPAKGQEAAQIGAISALRPTDMVYPSYRELSMVMHRGLDPLAVFQIMRGITHATWDVEAHHMGTFAFVVGAQTVQAVGYGMGITLDGSDEVVLVCLGDGATSEGHVNEALNFAAVYRAPVIFLVQNNQYAISVPTAQQFRGAPAARAAGFGMPGVRVDGNDLFAVNAVVAEAAARARAGEGPTLVEAMTYRIGAHTTADDPTRYRTREEEDLWAGRDPLVRTERWLREQGTDDDWFAALSHEADELATDLRARVLALEPQAITDLYDFVLAEPSDALAEEREQVAQYLAGLEGR
ncbi:MAG TPA: thiamine pyrophosphate-dependent enzyme [Propionibacteriaceae bacterium]|nr:thiamine pyrophosphate-dependent enzyme [Propionibacteriaceae bacterium]